MTRFSFYVMIISCILLASCSHTIGYNGLSDEDKEPIRSAVCSAKNFLNKNGYMEQKSVSEKKLIELEMWDNINYEKDGVFDWPRLLADRAGTFEERLYGVKNNDDEHLVYYRLEESFRCISVDTRRNKSSLREANCLVSDSVVRLKDTDIDCVE